MLDSNGCGGASAESLANGHTTSNIGFGQDQIEWYKAVLSNIKEISPETKFSAVFHIQLSVMNDAIGQYGEIPLNLYEIGRNGDYGYINAPTKLAWDSDKTVYNGLKTLGVDSIINGHEHWNNGGLYYDGVRFIYGLKSSTYDRYNSIASDGRVVTEEKDQYYWHSTFYSDNFYAFNMNQGKTDLSTRESSELPVRIILAF
jgi:hypothetical protein